jgi:CRISPR system Cascade subunit CasA
MDYNLLEEQWIFLKRRSGAIERAAPWQMTDNISQDPFVGFGSPRADFDASLAQFLIGLVQTTMPPKAPRDWRQRLTSPPNPEILRETFSEARHAFNLMGTGPRFMQDLEFCREFPPAKEPVMGLLMEAPGGNAIKNNTDLFIKRGYVDALCPACAAAALFTLQTNAPSGGQGHRTSLRGGGPLTTLVLGETLWETVWNNVLPLSELAYLACDTAKPVDGGVFPWTAPTRTSAKNGAVTHPLDVHPFHVFWGMPRRIVLHFETTPRECGICVAVGTNAVTRYAAKNYGNNYEKFIHPLSPHALTKEGVPIPLKGSTDSLGYRHWHGLAYAVAEAGNGPFPARTVRQYRKERLDAVRTLRTRAGENAPDFRLWAFGYDMDNMKARRWCEGLMPVMDIDEEARERYALNIEQLVGAAREVEFVLYKHLKYALRPENQDSAKSATLFDAAQARFWKTTEADFLAALEKLREALQTSGDTAMVRENWIAPLSKAAMDIFSALTDGAPFAGPDPERVARAHNGLRRDTSVANPKLRNALHLPALPSGEPGKAKRKPKTKEA